MGIAIFEKFENCLTEIMGQEQMLILVYKSKHRRDFKELAHTF